MEKQKVSFLSSLHPPITILSFLFLYCSKGLLLLFFFCFLACFYTLYTHKGSSRHLLENELKYQIFDTRFVVFDSRNIFAFRHNKVSENKKPIKINNRISWSHFPYFITSKIISHKGSYIFTNFAKSIVFFNIPNALRKYTRKKQNF